MKVPCKLELRVVFSSPPGEGFPLPVLFVLNDPVEDQSHGGVEEDLGDGVEKSITTSCAERGLLLLLLLLSDPGENTEVNILVLLPVRISIWSANSLQWSWQCSHGVALGWWFIVIYCLFHRVNWDDDDELLTQVIRLSADNTASNYKGTRTPRIPRILLCSTRIVFLMSLRSEAQLDI